MSAAARHKVEGHISRGFEPVREAFVDNFARRRELGGACCAYSRGEKVVDLWGGIGNEQTGDPWEQDTMVIIYSATKGLAAMTLAIAHSRFDEPVDRTVVADLDRLAVVLARQKPTWEPGTRQAYHAITCRHCPGPRSRV